VSYYFHKLMIVSIMISVVAA